MKSLLNFLQCSITRLDPRFGFVGRSTKVSIFARIQGHRNIRLGGNTQIDRDVVISASKGSISIGSGTRIYSHAMLMTYGGAIDIGDHSTINPYCVLYGHGGLSIGSFVRIAAGTIIIPANHQFTRVDIPIAHQGEHSRGIRIADDVWIGAHVTILDGVTINSGAIVAAGSVVNRDIDPYSVVAGVPARTIRYRINAVQI